MNNEYKGYYIEFDFYGGNEYSVQYCGDDLVFDTKEEAIAFIDEITNEDEKETIEMTRFDELMNMKGAELIAIAGKYELTINTNKERTQLKEAKKSVVAKIIKVEEERAARAAEKAAKSEAKKARVKMTDEEKKAKRAARYAAKKAKREEIKADRCAKTELIEFNGKAQTLTEWSKELGISRKNLYRRIFYYGWSVEKAFEKEAA